MLEQATRPAIETPMETVVSVPAARPAFRPVRPLRGLTFVGPIAPTSDLESFLKRALDLALALPALVVLGPLMLAVAIAIKLDSPGPVFIVQQRVSRGLRKFRMYKFRSMVKNADELIPSLQALNEATPPLFKIRNDPRITKLGRRLRKLSIDELPQLVNVLLGDMSLVGPRPERPYFVEQFKHRIPQYMLRHKVKAGITGWAQVNGWRGNTSLEKRIEYDLYYIENWSVTLDIKIMCLTVLRGLQKHAY